jgi:hypothetical protein
LTSPFLKILKADISKKLKFLSPKLRREERRAALMDVYCLTPPYGSPNERPTTAGRQRALENLPLTLRMLSRAGSRGYSFVL